MSIKAKFFQTPQAAETKNFSTEEVCLLVARSKTTLTNLFHTSKVITNNLAQKNDANPEILKNLEQITAKMKDTLAEIEDVYHEANDLAVSANFNWRH